MRFRRGGISSKAKSGRPKWHARRLFASSNPLIAGMLPLVLAACASTPLESYDLGLASVSVPNARQRAAISIQEPTAPEIINSSRVAIRSKTGDFAYLAGAQWSDRLPALVQRRMTESFDKAHLFREITETGTAADYLLALDIRRFEIDSETGDAVVEIAARLVSARTGRTAQGSVFKATAPAPASGAPGITQALDSAFSQVIGQILRFAVQRA